MSTIKTKNIQQAVENSTTQPLKIGGTAVDGSDAKIIVESDGTTKIRKTQILDDSIIVNKYNTGNRYASVKLIGDDTYTDYGAQLLRYSTGHTELMHRGTQTFNITAVDAAELKLSTLSVGRLSIDSSGRITTPYQPYIMGSPTNTTGSGIANYFAVKSSRGLSWSSDRITVPVAGVYAISFNTICDNSSTRVDTEIKINGANFLMALSEDATTGFHQRSISIMVNLAANDYIQFTNNDWYNAASTALDTWRTASVVLIG